MSKLTKNIGYNLVGQILLILLNLVAVRVIYKQLGSDVFGLIYFALTLNAIFRTVVSGGIGWSLVRETSRFFESDKKYLSQLIQTSSLLTIIIYVILTACVVLAAPFIVRNWLQLEELDINSAIAVLQILIVGILLSIPNAILNSILRGLEEMKIINLVEVFTSLIRQLGLVAVVFLSNTALMTAVWLSLSYMLVTIAYLYILRQHLTWSVFKPKFHRQVIVKNRDFGLNMLGISLTNLVHLQADKLIVSRLLPVATFGYYSFAYSLIGRLAFIKSAVSTAAFPTFARLYENGQREQLLEKYQWLQSLLIYLLVPFFAAVPFAIKPLFTYIFDEQVAELMIIPASIIALGSYMNLTLSMPYSVSLAVGKPEISSRSNFYALFIMLPTTVLLVYQWGLVGAASSWVLYHLFLYSYTLPRICRECLQISSIGWYKNVGSVVLSAALFYAIVWLIFSATDMSYLMRASVTYTLASFLFLVWGCYSSVEIRQKTHLLYGIAIQRIM